jgi:hypothetical protein
MALCASGAMSLGGTTEGRSVNLELGCTATASINMDRTDVRDLAEKVSGAIAMSDFYGKSSVPPPPELGGAYQGGIYMGAITAAGQCYALIVSPNATGCLDQCRMQQSNTFRNALSLVDGYNNTVLLNVGPGSSAVQFCASRTINGFSDWYLPAINELQTFYDNGATGGNESVIGSGEAFVGRQYWSSTEKNANYACYFRFNNGGRGYFYKDEIYNSRAVRREPI